MQLEAPARSYKARRGRMGVARQAALDTLLPRFAVPEGDALDEMLEHPVVLEIGFGVGASTLTMASAEPATTVIAADVHPPGVAALLQGLDEAGLDNVKVLLGDGRQFLYESIPAATLQGIRVYFPDPWPKGRHHKRRLVDENFAALAADRLAPGGLLHCSTDWEPYAQQMITVLAAEPGLELLEQRTRPDWRPVTRYEQRGLEQGHRVTDVFARRWASSHG